MFDEMTGELKKNYAEVKFQNRLDLGPWCLGSNGKAPDDSVEEWLLDPAESMIASRRRRSRIRGPSYELRAVVTHYGRHENGHYIAYRKHPALEEVVEGLKEEKAPRKSQWWRLSDDDVSQVSEDNVLNQGGVFMLFYDLVEASSLAVAKSDSAPTVEEATQPSEFMSFVNSQHPEFLATKGTTVNQSVTEGSSDTAAQPDNQVSAESAPETIAQSDNHAAAETTSEVNGQPGNEVANEDEKASEKASDDASEEASEVGSDETADYEPTEPIHIKPYVRQAGRQHDEGRRKSSIQGSSGGMVMV
jgi:ubiquitin carboxyl-terminal hydrolase 1